MRKTPSFNSVYNVEYKRETNEKKDISPSSYLSMILVEDADPQTSVIATEKFYFSFQLIFLITYS